MPLCGYRDSGVEWGAEMHRRWLYSRAGVWWARIDLTELSRLKAPNEDGEEILDGQDTTRLEKRVLKAMVPWLRRPANLESVWVRYRLLGNMASLTLDAAAEVRMAELRILPSTMATAWRRRDRHSCSVESL